MTIDIADELGSAYPVFSYTATKLTPREVARTFVPPAAFPKLRDARNAILVGPRGSGKTTLLKMLTSEGLSAWDTDDGASARERVQDVGVFVGVDATWSEQIRRTGYRASESFGAAAYALHIARSFAQTMLFRTGRDANDSLPHQHLQLAISKPDEVEIASRASRLFKLDYLAPSFRSLDHALGDRLNELGTYRYRLPDGQPLPDWAYLNPLQAISELALMVNMVAGEPTRRWALLFDELELAPSSIVQDILRRLRGHEPVLVFKLSLAPILRSTELLEGERGATHGQDVEYIPLTAPERSDDFVAELFEKQRQVAGLPRSLTPRLVLGESVFDTGDSGGRRKSRVDPYRQGGPVWSAMHWLRDHDPSFMHYLDASGIELGSLDELPPHARAARIRKIRNLVIVRAHFRDGARRDTQSTRALYTGEATLLAFPDGNPRMSTILVRELMSDVADAAKMPLGEAAQAAAVDATTTRFLALLHAQKGLRFGERAVTMMTLIDAVGNALNARIVRSAFSADVPGGFFVDRAFPERLMPLLTQAVNTGAIIHIPKDNSAAPVAASARGRHYRLSYLLAPRYGLPIRQGKTVALWNLLDGSSLASLGPAHSSRQRRGRSQTPIAGLEADGS